MNVLAIIPVYKNYAQRDRCVDALQKQTAPVEIFTHDNTNENIGYTKACNRGLRDALKRGFTYAMLINQDCYAEPNAVERLLAMMENKPKCGVAGPMQVRAERPDEVIHAGCKVAYPAGINRGSGSRAAGAFSTSEQVAWINGACMFMRMEAVVEVGLLDENMFLIGSDSDWCLTARLRGWEAWYCADACVLHEGGISASLPPLATLRIFQNDMDYFRRKWVGTVAHRQLDRAVGEPRFIGSIFQALQKGLADHQAGRFLDAEITYRDVLDIDPKNGDALHLMGVLAIQHGWPVIAHDYLAKAVEQLPQVAAVHMHLAAALGHMQQKEEARREYLEAVRLESASSQPLDAIAVELTNLGFPEDAAATRAKAASLRQRIPAQPGIIRQ